MAKDRWYKKKSQTCEGRAMSLSEHIFQLRSDGSLKPIQKRIWNQLLSRTQPLVGAEFQTLHFLEVEILLDNHKPQSVHAIKRWDVGFNKLGYAESKRWQMCETPALTSSLEDLLPQPDVRAHQQLSDLLDSMMGVVGVKAVDCKAVSQEQFIDQLLAVN
jgi:hypothetical protein